METHKYSTHKIKEGKNFCRLCITNEALAHILTLTVSVYIDCDHTCVRTFLCVCFCVWVCVRLLSINLQYMYLQSRSWQLWRTFPVIDLHLIVSENEYLSLYFSLLHIHKWICFLWTKIYIIVRALNKTYWNKFKINSTTNSLK